MRRVAPVVQQDAEDLHRHRHRQVLVDPATARLGSLPRRSPAGRRPGSGRTRPAATMPHRWLRSRKNTLAADSNRLSPTTKPTAARRPGGPPGSAAAPACPKNSITTDSTPSSMSSVASEAATLASTRCSRGNATFLTSPPLPSTVAHRRADADRHVVPRQDGAEDEQAVRLEPARVADRRGRLQQRDEDERVDQHRRQRVEHRPRPAQRAALVARAQLAQREVPEQLTGAGRAQRASTSRIALRVAADPRDATRRRARRSPPRGRCSAARRTASP